jgi:hypothetical protein
MNKSRQWLLVLFLLQGIMAYSQCNYQLVEKAAQLAGSNTVYLRDFKVRLSEATADDPVPTGRFPVYLNQGVNYRFTIANAAEAMGNAHVELIRRGQVLASNSEFDMLNQNSFDFICERSANYQVQVNFGEGKEGCAAIVLSLVLDDSLTYIKPGVPLETDSLETIYLWTENEVQIATTLGKGYTPAATVSQGSITQRGKFFYIEPKEEGQLVLIATILDNEGRVAEGDTLIYKVDYPPYPLIELPGERNGNIDLREFRGFSKVNLFYFNDAHEHIYSLKQFTLSLDRVGVSALQSYSEELTVEQIQFVRQLKPGDSFYITDALVTDPEGQVHRLNSRQIYISE